MPNWVYNRVDGYTPEMMEKYKETYTNKEGEEKVSPISFQKIIPMPEIYKEIPSSSVARDAEMIFDYNKYKEETPEDKRTRWDTIKLDRELHSQRDNMYHRIGQMCVEHPNSSLNELLMDEKYSFDKERLERIRKAAGNDICRFPGETRYEQNDPNRPTDKDITKQKIEMLDRYAEAIEDHHRKEKEREQNDPDKRFPVYNYKFDSLLEMGKAMNEAKEKYGAKDWYDWCNLYWGTKWDAGDAEYDEEEQTIRFDTAWAPPEQIFAKMQEDFPDAKFSIHSEEETGWFNEYETKEDGKIHQTISGEYTYKEDEDGEWVEDETKEEEVDRILTTGPDEWFQGLIDTRGELRIMSKVIFEEDSFKDYDAATTFDPDEDEEMEIEKSAPAFLYGETKEVTLTPEEILKKNIKSLESQAKHSKNPMEQRQLRQKIGKLQMKLKYKDYGMF